MLASLAITPLPAHAEEPDASSLQKEVEQLRQEVQTLKEQVKSLQGTPPASLPPQTQPVAKESDPASTPQAQPAPNSAPPPIPAGAKPAAAASPQAQPAPNAVPPSVPVAAKPAADSIVALRESWRQVERGMTQAQISGLLGAPTKEMTINGKLVWYYYYRGIGGASVFFNGNGHVSSHQPPTVGWW